MERLTHKMLKIRYETWKRLYDIKSELSKKRGKEASFDDAISFLLDEYERGDGEAPGAPHPRESFPNPRKYAKRYVGRYEKSGGSIPKPS